MERLQEDHGEGEQVMNLSSGLCDYYTSSFVRWGSVTESQKIREREREPQTERRTQQGRPWRRRPGAPSASVCTFCEQGCVRVSICVGVCAHGWV